MTNVNLHCTAVNATLAEFPGAKLIAAEKPLFCDHCDRRVIPQYRRAYTAGSPTRELVAILGRRRGKIIERTWSNGRREWACHYCQDTEITEQTSIEGNNHGRKIS